MAERLRAWPDAELVRVWPSTVIVADQLDFVAAGVYRGLYERAEATLIRRLLPSGPGPRLAVDVGANVGYHTALMAELVGPEGKVLAFEPAAKTFRRLRALVEGAPLPNVDARQLGLGRASSTLVLRDIGGQTNTGLATLRPGAAAPSPALLPGASPGEEIEVVRLDDVPELQGGPSIDLVKIDVEGFEAEVLAGASGLVRSGRIDHMIVEVSPQFGPIDFARQLLVDAGPDYVAYKVEEAGSIRRRLRLRSLDEGTILDQVRQFNLLVSRRDAPIDLTDLVVRGA